LGADHPALLAQGITAGYGGAPIIQEVELSARRGRLTAVVGPNGAGKSTLLKAMSGLITPTAGKISLDGDDITGADAEAVTRAGVSLMPGGKGIFPTVTVEEHLRLAAWTFRKDTARIDAARADVLDLFPILAERTTQPAGFLSGGAQQMLALAQAFMPEPRLLLVDELSLGLAPVVVMELLEVVRRLRNEGVAVVLVEQSAELALQVAGLAVAVRRRRNYDVGFLRGSPSHVVRDSLWAGTAYSAPIYLLAAQSWATARLRRQPDDGARRLLGMLGVLYGPGYLCERYVRAHLRRFDPVETPIAPATCAAQPSPVCTCQWSKRAGKYRIGLPCAASTTARTLRLMRVRRASTPR